MQRQREQPQTHTCFLRSACMHVHGPAYTCTTVHKAPITHTNAVHGSDGASSSSSLGCVCSSAPNSGSKWRYSALIGSWQEAGRPDSASQQGCPSRHNTHPATDRIMYTHMRANTGGAEQLANLAGGPATPTAGDPLTCTHTQHLLRLSRTLP